MFLPFPKPVRYVTCLFPKVEYSYSRSYIECHYVGECARTFLEKVLPRFGYMSVYSDFFGLLVNPCFDISEIVKYLESYTEVSSKPFNFENQCVSIWSMYSCPRNERK